MLNIDKNKALIVALCCMELLFLSLLIVSLFTPTPMLLAAPGTIEERVYPRLVGEDLKTALAEPSGLDIQPVSPSCINVTTSGQGIVSHVCHPHLHCGSASGVEVHKGTPVKGIRSYLVIYGSCEFFCCDLRGTLMGPDGRRLDDSLLDRTMRRLEWVGGFFALVGMIVAGWLWIVGRRRSEFQIPRNLTLFAVASTGLACWYVWKNL